VAISKKVYGFAFSLPLLISTAFYAVSSNQIMSPNQQTTSANGTSSTVNIFNPQNKSNITEITSTNPKLFLMNLTSGDRPIYERKASWGALQWGDRFIPIYGNITTIPFNKSDIVNKIVMIQAYQKDDLVYEKFVRTGENGNFSVFFYPPEDVTVKVVATLTGVNSTARGMITVIATQAWAPAILISIFISLAIFSIVIAWHYYQTKTKTVNNQQVKQDKYLKWGILPTVIFTLLSYIVLYKFPPFDAAGNAVVATGLIAP
jgi:hypothetical protein